jgi:competence protein ComEA
MPLSVLFNSHKAKEEKMKKAILTMLMIFLWTAVAIAAVDINTAGQKELAALPGIGAVKAEAIVKHRQENGPFASVDDLAKVKGIGRKSLESIREHLEVKK